MSTGTLDQGRPLQLVADIGGTHVRFALCPSVAEIAHVSVLKRADFSSLEDAIRQYLQSVGQPAITQAAIGIANPIMGDRVKMTNSSWEFSTEAMRLSLGLKDLHLINDFTALAFSLPHLPPKELVQLGGASRVASAPSGLLGPGTGLGVSALIPTRDQGWTALASEGGHSSFAPHTLHEDMLWQEAHRQYGHVSMERLVSGPGLQFIYRTLCQLGGNRPHDYTPAQITARAMDNRCDYCRDTLDAFCAALGTAASDLALTLGARGGIYIGGGIVPRIVDYFISSPFRARFEDKGRFAEYLSAIPVFIITSPNPGLVGAAAYLQLVLRESQK